MSLHFRSSSEECTDMERNDERHDELIDLGAASTETQGRPGLQLEFGVIAQPVGIEAE